MFLFQTKKGYVSFTPYETENNEHKMLHLVAGLNDKTVFEKAIELIDSLYTQSLDRVSTGEKIKNLLIKENEKNAKK